MKRLGMLLCAASFLAGPAFSQDEIALVAPTDVSGPEARIDGVVLSPAAQAIEGELAQEAEAGNRAESALIEEIRIFYAARSFEPLWFREGRGSVQMSGLKLRMDGADREGLDPAEYATPAYAPVLPDEPARIAAAEVEFTRAAVRFVTHLASGRLEPGAVSPIITQTPERPSVADILSKLGRTADVTAALAHYEPPHPEFSGLKRRLAEVRAEMETESRIAIPEGPALRPGGSDPRAPLLRQRLGLPALQADDAEVHDPALADALRSFQKANALEADGILGPRTIAALNGLSKADQIATILVNMERWRWMPRDLGRFHVFVNVPEFTIRVREDGKAVHETRAVVGKPDSPTPVFSQPMDHIVVNPFWNVPSSIVKNEMLSEIRQNPHDYFARKGYQVLAQSGGKMQVIDPLSVDWWAEKPKPVRIRQVPGDANALGRIKFMFPNQHAVYLHDTPSKKLFAREFRAYSHGCVRVDNPLEFADAVLRIASPKWNSQRIEKLYGGAERWIKLANPVPVHLAYFTTGESADGSALWFGDVYGFDRRMRAAMDL